MKIPIIVMTKDEGKHLELCINSILLTVKSEYVIYIIDNASKTERQKNILKKLALLENVNIVYNSRNLWILGLNKTLSKIKEKYKSKYFFLTDGDIDFTSVQTNGCWLQYLVNIMEDNRSLGKVGFSLSWSYIEQDPYFEEILKQEKSLYNECKKIGDLYISPVDTTAALFKSDWSVDKTGLFYPDHMKYLKPEYYSCRTPKNITVDHLGWESYGENRVEQNLIDDKIICFTLVGGYVKKEILSQSSIHARLFYKVCSRLILKLWVLRRYSKSFFYCVNHIKKGFFGQHM